MAIARRFELRILVPAALAILLAGACGNGTASETPAPEPSGAIGLDEVRLQLQSVPQAQFAGYFAAIEQGYYEANGINVTIVPGGPDVVPQQVGSAVDGPEFTISWVPAALEAREGSPRSDLVHIGQVFRRSGTLSISWRDAEITMPADLEGRRVGAWEAGNGYEVIAGAGRAGLEPGEDFELVPQGPGVAQLLSNEVDVAQAMIYNEFAQVLETVNPETGNLFQPTDLNAINWVDEGTAMLQDAIFARASWIQEGNNEDLATRFLEASFQGWIYCRSNQADCIAYTIEAGATFEPGTALGVAHQAWMLNEVNGLIWPSPQGIGMLDEARWRETVEVALQAGAITREPPADAFRTDLAAAALAGITEDAIGAAFQKGVVEISPGGE